ncbi:MAG: GerAB/ArcD/ProY family transporter [Candidatus Improbicoccus devescovinae]|nr:MAG: GerAB/ArcD/ProY family transporter [Candidatus Improbicoccus devescovinae]
MVNKRIISSSQLFSMLLVCMIVITSTFGPEHVGYKDFWDCVISCGAAYLLNFIMILPIYFIYKSHPTSDIITVAEKSLGKFSIIIKLIYASYFILVCAHTLATFKSFIENVMNPPVSFMLLSMLLITLTCYAAAKGIEAIARAAVIMLFFIITSLIFLGISLRNNIDYTNFKPFFYEGIDSVINGILFFISRSSCIPILGLLLPYTKIKKIKTGIFVWNTIFYAIMTGAIIIVIGTLGDFAQTRIFPIYSTASIAKILSLENLDILYLGLWTSGIFIKLALFINLAAKCLKETFGGKNSKTCITLLGILLIFTTSLTSIVNITHGIFNINIILISTILTACLIPIIILISNKILKFKK